MLWYICDVQPRIIGDAKDVIAAIHAKIASIENPDDWKIIITEQQSSESEQSGISCGLISRKTRRNGTEKSIVKAINGKFKDVKIVAKTSFSAAAILKQYLPVDEIHISGAEAHISILKTVQDLVQDLGDECPRLILHSEGIWASRLTHIEVFERIVKPLPGVMLTSDPSLEGSTTGLLRLAILKKAKAEGVLTERAKSYAPLNELFGELRGIVPATGNGCKIGVYGDEECDLLLIDVEMEGNPNGIIHMTVEALLFQFIDDSEDPGFKAIHGLVKQAQKWTLNP